MMQKAQSSMPSWRKRLHEPAFIERLENAERQRLRLSSDHIQRMDAAISVVSHLSSKNTVEAAADKRHDKLRTAAVRLLPLVQKEIEKGEPVGLPRKHCVPGCEDASAFLKELKGIVSARRRVKRPRGSGHPSDEVIDFMLQTIWKIYCEAGGTGTTGSKAFARFLAELVKVMPKHLLGNHEDPAGWLIRRAKNLGRCPRVD